MLPAVGAADTRLFMLAEWDARSGTRTFPLLYVRSPFHGEPGSTSFTARALTRVPNCPGQSTSHSPPAPTPGPRPVTPPPGRHPEVLLDEVAHDGQGQEGHEEHRCDVGDDGQGGDTEQRGAAQALQRGRDVLREGRARAGGEFWRLMTFCPARCQALFPHIVTAGVFCIFFTATPQAP